MKKYVFLGFLFILAACSSNSSPVSLNTVLPNIEDQFTELGTISSGELINDSSPTNQFSVGIKSAQCKQKKADPTIPVIDGDVVLNLSGSYSKTGGFSIGSVTTSPSLSLSGSTTKGNQQQLNLPIKFTALSTLPDVLMAHQLSYRSPIFSSVNGEVARYMLDDLHDIIDNKNKLKVVVTSLIANYSITQCSSNLSYGPISGTVLHIKR